MLFKAEGGSNQQKTACEKFLAISLAYLADYEVLHGGARGLVSNPLKFLLVIYVVHVLILWKHQVQLIL